MNKEGMLKMSLALERLPSPSGRGRETASAFQATLRGKVPNVRFPLNPKEKRCGKNRRFRPSTPSHKTHRMQIKRPFTRKTGKRDSIRSKVFEEDGVDASRVGRFGEGELSGGSFPSPIFDGSVMGCGCFISAAC